MLNTVINAFLDHETLLSVQKLVMAKATKNLQVQRPVRSPSLGRQKQGPLLRKSVTVKAVYVYALVKLMLEEVGVGEADVKHHTERGQRL